MGKVGRLSGAEDRRLPAAEIVPRLLFQCFRGGADGGPADIAQAVADLGPDRRLAFFEAAGWHGVVQMLQGAFGDHSAILPADCAAFVEAAAALNARRNGRLVAQADEIVGATEAAGLAPVFLKGTALLLDGLHADPAARLVGDIDLLVEPGRLEETARALAAVGYRRLPDRVAHAHDTLRLLRADRPGLVELHVSPVAFALADALPAADVTARARPARLLAAARIPCPDDLLVHSLAHALLQDHGLRLGELQLRTALDIVRLAGSHSGTIDWDAVAGRLGLVPAGRDAFGFALLASGEALAAPDVLPAPRATSRATRSLAAWRRRNGGPASPATRGRAFLGAYARDWLWRLRHDPDQRRHFAARLLSPRSYPGIARALVAVATDGPPASPRDPCPTHR